MRSVDSRRVGVCRIAVRVAVSCALLFVARATFAQTGATLTVRMTGAAAQSLVTVEPTHGPPGRSASAGSDGSVTFRGVPPGSYVVSLSDPAMVRETVRLEPGDVVTLVATPGAGLIVTAHYREWHGASFRGHVLDDLPASPSAWAVIETAEPFVIADRIDGGGLITGRTNVIGSRGASWTTNSVNFDGAFAPPPTSSGELGLLPDLAAVASVEVTTGMAPVDVREPGASVSLVARRPSAALEGSVDAEGTGGRMVSTNAKPGVPSIARLDSSQREAGGLSTPIGPGAGLLVSGADSRAVEEDRGNPLHVPSRADSLSGHFVRNAGPNDQWRALGAWQHVSHPFDGAAALADRTAAETGTFGQASVTWDHFGSSGTRRQLAFGFDHADVTPKVVSSVAGGTLDRIFDGAVPSPPASLSSERLTGKVEFDPRDRRAGGTTHSFRLGATIDRTAASMTTLALPTVAELVDGLPARIWVPQAPTAPSDRRITEAALFAEDRIQLGPRLTVDAGLRADLTRGSAAGAPQGISWATLAPRVSAHWSPRALTIFASYGRYQPRVSLDWLAFGDPSQPWFQVYRWNDLNGNHVFDPGELGALVERAGHGQAIGSIDASLKAPSTDEVTFGLERRFGTLLRVEATAVLRHESNRLASLNVGAPVAASYSTFTVLDPGTDFSGATDDRLLTVYNRLPASFGLDRYLLSTVAGDTATYDGLELSATISGDRLFMQVGAMAYFARTNGGNPGFRVLENDQGVIGTRFEDPNAAPFEPGANFFDRSYVLKWSLAYSSPHDLHFGVVARYQDGQPFARIAVIPDVNQGPDIIQAYRSGRTRFTYTLTLDARLEQDMKIGRARAGVFVDVFNLLNMANEVEEDVVGGPTFRDATALQPPRTIRAGLRVRF